MSDEPRGVRRRRGREKQRHREDDASRHGPCPTQSESVSHRLRGSPERGSRRTIPPRARLGPRGYLAPAVEPRLVARARRVVSAGRGEASCVVKTHYLRALFFRPGTTEISLLRPLG